MNRQEVNALLVALFSTRENPQVVNPDEIDSLEQQMKTVFPASFRAFLMELPKFYSSGGFLGVIEGDLYADPIDSVYEAENKLGTWSSDHIPIYDVGNGDFYILMASEGVYAHVYYIEADRNGVQLIYNSVDDWLRDLPQILGLEPRII